MDQAGITQAAAILAAARQNRTRIAPLPPACTPQTVAEAHAIQDGMAVLLNDTITGYKANATPDPVRAPIFAASTHTSPAAYPAADSPQCGVEGEVAFRFTEDLPPRPTPYTTEEVAAALEACAAIEVVTSRYADPDAVPFLARLADCVSNGGFVHGETTPNWQHLDRPNLKVTLTVNNETVVNQNGGHPAGDPLPVAVALAEMLRPTTGIKAGQFVTCGSYTGIRYLQPGDMCRVTFGGLGSAQLTFIP